MQRTIVRNKPLPLDELYGILYGKKQDDYHTFIDRKDVCNNTIPEEYNLMQDSFVKVQELIDF